MAVSVSRFLAVVVPLLLSCGSKAFPGDDGDDAGHNGGDGDGDADVDGGGDGAAPIVVCNLSARECPQGSYCCGYDHRTCAPEPFGPPRPTEYWECVENPVSATVVSSDCVHFGDFNPEECPQEFPQCCSWDDGEDYCSDHLLIGWLCNEERVHWER